MLEDVRRSLPNEACGLLAGVGEEVRLVLPVRNEAASPVRFRMAPREQLAAFRRIEEAGLQLLGIYHSHPGGPDHLSPTDLAEAAYAEAAYLVWFPTPKGWRCRAFRLDRARPEEIPLVLEPDVSAGGG